MSVRFRREPHPAPAVLEVPTLRNLNLLGHAQMDEFGIGSQCGGHGVCGADRIQVVVRKGAVSPPNATERKLLGQALVADGWRLGCQCYPESDDAEIDVFAPLLSGP